MLIALARALASLAHPRMLFLMLWPLLAAAALWIALAVAFWSQAAQWVDLHLQANAFVQWMLTFWPLAFIVAHLALVVLALAFVPLVLVTAVLIIGIFAMPMMAEHVAARDYPDLARRRGGNFAGSVWNSIVALAVFVLLGVVTLPLWVVPLFWPLIPVLLYAYLNQRVLRYDALAEHASEREIALLIERHRTELFWLGVVVALIGHVPLIGLFSPVYGGLAFIHFCLQRLQDLRTAPLEGSAERVVE
jgi:CysZ protein